MNLELKMVPEPLYFQDVLGVTICTKACRRLQSVFDWTSLGFRLDFARFLTGLLYIWLGFRLDFNSFRSDFDWTKKLQSAIDWIRSLMVPKNILLYLLEHVIIWIIIF